MCPVSSEMSNALSSRKANGLWMVLTTGWIGYKLGDGWMPLGLASIQSICGLWKVTELLPNHICIWKRDDYRLGREEENT